MSDEITKYSDNELKIPGKKLPDDIKSLEKIMEEIKGNQESIDNYSNMIAMLELKKKELKDILSKALELQVKTQLEISIEESEE